MIQTKESLERRKKALVDRIERRLDFLIGSVVTYRVKCGKDCNCNNGKRHSAVYLSTKQRGKTRNLYLPKELAAQAREMSRNYAQLKEILRELSELNYEVLRAGSRNARPPKQ